MDVGFERGEVRPRFGERLAGEVEAVVAHATGDVVIKIVAPPALEAVAKTSPAEVLETPVGAGGYGTGKRQMRTGADSRQAGGRTL